MTAARPPSPGPAATAGKGLSGDARPTVFYDGSCPLCRAEIGLYRRDPAGGALDYVDVCDAAARLPDGLDRRAALARFHVMAPSGAMLSGAAAFVEVWRTLPRWRWLARLASLPLALPLLEGAYRLFLHARPLLVRVFVLLNPSRDAGRGGGP